jgi:TonB family protein
MQPAPSLSNGCGRNGPIFLIPIASTHKIAPYPPDAVQNHEAGRALLRVVVNKEGDVSEATVTKSSGFTDLDEAALISVKENWRWQPPPAECADMGVVVPVFYDWRMAASGP